jgi:hypothetical protein
MKRRFRWERRLTVGGRECVFERLDSAQKRTPIMAVPRVVHMIWLADDVPVTLAADADVAAWLKASRSAPSRAYTDPQFCSAPSPNTAEGTQEVMLTAPRSPAGPGVQPVKEKEHGRKFRSSAVKDSLIRLAPMPALAKISKSSNVAPTRIKACNPASFVYLYPYWAVPTFGN